MQNILQQNNTKDNYKQLRTLKRFNNHLERTIMSQVQLEIKKFEEQQLMSIATLEFFP